MGDRKAEAPRILVVGSANADMIMNCGSLPRSGETVTASDPRWAGGGKGANQAVAAARLGADVAFVGCIGADAAGERVRQGLDAEGIDLDGLRVVPERATGIAVVVVDARGDNLIVLAPGANAALGREDIQKAATAIARAAIVVCQLETPLSAVDATLDVAAANGTAVWLNPAPAQALPEGWLPRLELVVPNQAEVETLTGVDARTPEGAARAAADLRRRGARSVVVTLGASGALIADHDGTRLRPALPVAAVDTTGAGDAFIGGLAFARATGRTIDAAVDFAQVVAASKVTRPGAQAALPTAKEVAAFAAAMRPRQDG